jgi:hypothetical protein
MITNHFKSQFSNPSSFLILILHSAFGRLRPKARKPPPPPPPPVHDFVLKNLASEFPGEIQTAAYAGQVQLIVFFRTDDAPCRGSIPDWNALQQEFADRGFTVVGVIVDDRNPDLLEIAAEAIALGATFPLGLADAPVVAPSAAPPPSAPSPPPSSSPATVPSPHLFRLRPLAPLRDDIDAALDGLPLPLQ